MRSYGNTGPKGVLKDYEEAKERAKVRMQTKNQKAVESIEKHSLLVKTDADLKKAEEKQRAAAEKAKKGNFDEDEDEENWDEDDEEFFQQYYQKKMQEMQQLKVRLWFYPLLFYISVHRSAHLISSSTTKSIVEGEPSVWQSGGSDERDIREDGREPEPEHVRCGSSLSTPHQGVCVAEQMPRLRCCCSRQRSLLADPVHRSQA